MGASTAVLGLGCRAYIVTAKERVSATRKLALYAATMGHPEVPPLVYGRFFGGLSNKLGWLLTTMILTEHGGQHPNFDPRCAVVGRTVPVDETSLYVQGADPHGTGVHRSDAHTPGRPFLH